MCVHKVRVRREYVDKCQTGSTASEQLLTATLFLSLRDTELLHGSQSTHYENPFKRPGTARVVMYNSVGRAALALSTGEKDYSLRKSVTGVSGK